MRLMLLLVLFLMVPFSYGYLHEQAEEGFVSDEVIIKFKSDQGLEHLKQVMDQCKLSKKGSMCGQVGSLGMSSQKKLQAKRIAAGSIPEFAARGLDRTYVMKVDDPLEAISLLEDNPMIEYIEPNYKVEVLLMPTDPDFGQCFGLHNTGQTGGTADADIDAPEAWDMERGSEDVVVAVIDTGVDYNHEDLAGNMWKNPDEIPDNGIDDDGNGYVDDYHGYNFYSDSADPFDDHGHGTHCSGTIGAVANNGVGVAGVAWNVSIMPLKFLSSYGSGSTDDAVLAIEYATMMGADIMSNSWGGGAASSALSDAIESAKDAGVMFVAAAGNYGDDSDSDPMYPAAYPNDNIISVAATDHDDKLAYFSNYGVITVDVGAPGVDVYSSVPTGSCSLCDSSGYRELSGTSMATPHVAGAAAVVWSAFPDASWQEIKARLIYAGDQTDALSEKVLSGRRLNLFGSLQDDSIAPAKIEDLAITEETDKVISLQWTAPGDDGNIGNVSTYEVRYSGSTLTEDNFDQASLADNYLIEWWTPVKQDFSGVAGTEERFTVPNLLFGKDYHIGVKGVDDTGNYGPLSNVVKAHTTDLDYVFYDDMENGMNGWEGSGQWHLESAKHNSKNTSWTYNSGPPDYNYKTPGEANSGRLLSPIFNFTDDKEAALRLYSYFGGYDWDYFYFNIYYPNGTPLYDEPGLSFREVDDVQNAWQLIEIDLTLYKNMMGSMRVGFTMSASSYTYGGWGWSIDDFAVVVGDDVYNEPPYARFYVNKSYALVTDVLHFDGTSTVDPDGDNLTYLWDLGDGTIAYGEEIEHSYMEEGTYIASLVVNDGKENSYPYTRYIYVKESNEPPVASCGGPYVEYSGTRIYLDSTGSYDPDNDSLYYNNYRWSFSDGTYAYGPSPSKLFMRPTELNVTLVIDDDWDLSEPCTASIIILENESNTAPVASCGGPYSSAYGEYIQFNSSGSYDPDGSELEYRWSFGDGHSSSAENPLRRYYYSGVFNVSLYVFDGQIASETVSTLARVGVECETDADCDDGLFCNGQEVCYKGECADAKLIISDGIACTLDYCDEDSDKIIHEPDDSFCDDKLFCNGEEKCDAEHDCFTASMPPIDDKIICTQDICHEENDTIEHIPDNSYCLDGLWCNGDEYCEPEAAVGTDGCYQGDVPDCTDAIGCTIDSCKEGDVPDDNMGYCYHDYSECSCAIDADCDDGNPCTDESCTEELMCNYSYNDAGCDDGFWCTERDSCNQGICVGEEKDVDDGISCTKDYCDESTDSVRHVPRDDMCNDSLFCNGVEVCDADVGCVVSSKPIIEDEFECTIDSCDEAADTIIHVPDDSVCDDGLFCNGDETCDASHGCVIPEEDRNCNDDMDCTLDVCNETLDKCVSTPIDIDDDGYDICHGDDEDCDDMNPLINPGQDEDCDNLKDDDCDSYIDGDDTDCQIEAECEANETRLCPKQQGVCNGSYEVCIDGSWSGCGDPEYSSPNRSYENTETLCDGLDNDCDGGVDLDLTTACGTDKGICKKGTRYCEEGSWGDCKNSTSPINERCGDNKDNDCDGKVDEGCSSGGGGSGGGGGSSGGSRTISPPSQSSACTERWVCDPWGECAPEGLKYRLCEDKNSCGTESRRPEVIETCTYTGTCTDSLKNGNEEGIDCGGRCTQPCEDIQEEKKPEMMIFAEPIYSEVMGYYELNVTLRNAGTGLAEDVSVEVDRWSGAKESYDVLLPGDERDFTFGLMLPDNSDHSSLKVMVFSKNALIKEKEVPVHLEVPEFAMKLRPDPNTNDIHSAFLLDNKENTAREIYSRYEINKDQKTYVVKAPRPFDVQPNETIHRIEPLLLKDLPDGNYEVRAEFYEGKNKIGEHTETFRIESGNKAIDLYLVSYMIMILLVLVTLMIFISAKR